MSVRPSVVFENIFFEETAEGYIRCQDDGDTLWCQHIVRLVKAGGDAPMLWQRKDQIIYGDNGEEHSDIQISVPFVPTKKMWINVTLEWTSIPNTRQLSIDEFDGKDYPMVGYVHPGEGRNAFRSMIYQWFLGVSNPDRICSNSTHGWKEEQQWLKVVGEARTAEWLYHKWYLFANDGICSFCDARNMDFSDLVPGSEHETYSGRVGDF